MRKIFIIEIVAVVMLIVSAFILSTNAGRRLLARSGLSNAGQSERCEPSIAWYSGFVAGNQSELASVLAHARAIASRTKGKWFSVRPSGAETPTGASVPELLKRMESSGMWVGRIDGAVIEIEMCAKETMVRGYTICLAYFDRPPTVRDSGRLSQNDDIEVFNIDRNWYVLKWN